MPELEDRLTTALRAAGDRAPDALGLAEAAHGRARLRRWRTTAVSAGAGLAVVAVVAGGVLLLSGGGPHANRVATETGATAPAPTSRVETWRDASVTVAASWGDGALTTWCTQGSEPGTPVVARPGGVVEAIACTPAQGYGVQFSDPADFDHAKSPGEVWQYHAGDLAVAPEGAWMGYQANHDVVAAVIAPTKEEAAQVLASFQDLSLAGRDANGCATKAGNGRALAPATGTMQLCRYGGDAWLQQSEVLTGQDAVEAVAALDAAPPSPAKPCPTPADDTSVQVATSDQQGAVALDACIALSWGGEHRDLTPDVLHWVLTPGWSGSVPAGLSGVELRR